jgi:hypothetical protein
MLEVLVLFLGSTKYLSRISSPPLFCLRNWLASSPLNCMVGIKSYIILVNIEGAKEIDFFPSSWIILFSKFNLYAHN